MARPLDPFTDQVDELAVYRAEIEAAGHDPEPFLERATVLKYAFIAPSRQEAQDLAAPGSSGTSRSSST